VNVYALAPVAGERVAVRPGEGLVLNQCRPLTRFFASLESTSPRQRGEVVVVDQPRMYYFTSRGEGSTSRFGASGGSSNEMVSVFFTGLE
jgi:hypothetical protein